MEQWIRNLITSTTTSLVALINAAYERIAWVYNVVTMVGASIRVAWGFFRGVVKFKLQQLISLASELYLNLWWIVFIRIPQIASDTLNKAIAWAVQTINSVRSELSNWISQVIRWAEALINGVQDYIGRLERWIYDKILTIETFIREAGALVFGLLTDPAKMARWVIGALFTELILLIDSNAEAILEWFRNKSTTLAYAVATRIEDVLTRML